MIQNTIIVWQTTDAKPHPSHMYIDRTVPATCPASCPRSSVTRFTPFRNLQFTIQKYLNTSLSLSLSLSLPLSLSLLNYSLICVAVGIIHKRFGNSHGVGLPCLLTLDDSSIIWFVIYIGIGTDYPIEVLTCLITTPRTTLRTISPANNSPVLITDSPVRWFSYRCLTFSLCARMICVCCWYFSWCQEEVFATWVDIIENMFVVYNVRCSHALSLRCRFSASCLLALQMN